jgi:hypothetical protein
MPIKAADLNTMVKMASRGALLPGMFANSEWLAQSFRGAGRFKGSAGIFTALTVGTIEAGSATDPTEGAGSKVYRIVTGGVSEEIDEDVVLWNPLGKLSGTVTVADMGGGEYLIVGFWGIECTEITYVDSVFCNEYDEIDYTTESIQVVTGPCYDESSS